MINTRSENIEGTIYCAYCGKELRNGLYNVYPQLPLICTCELAKEELALYDKLKLLYNHPLANNLIEKKVELYRNQLLGRSTNNGNTYVTGITTLGNTSVDMKDMNVDYTNTPDTIGITMVNLNQMNGDEH